MKYVLLLLMFGTAQAGTVYLKEPPPPQGMYALDYTPWTFVTGFSADGNTVEGVCGYGQYQQRGQAWFSCSWDLSGTPLGFTDEICCDSYDDRPPKVVYGPFANYLGDTAGVKYNRPYLATP
jgi:hypothetical protein